MSLGEDLKEVFAEVGTAFTILRDEGNISGEFLIYEINRQVTKPFVREFFYEAEFAYDTVVVPGDVVVFDDSRRFLVANVTDSHFENSAIEKEGVLYKCNITSGRLWRYSGEDWDETSYRVTEDFQIVYDDVSALMTEGLYGHELEEDEEIGQIGQEGHEIYMSGNLSPQALDIWEPTSGEFFEVRTIKTRRYENIKVVEAVEQTRTKTV
jgi:hypothetical protein